MGSAFTFLGAGSVIIIVVIVVMTSFPRAVTGSIHIKTNNHL